MSNQSNIIKWTPSYPPPNLAPPPPSVSGQDQERPSSSGGKKKKSKRNPVGSTAGGKKRNATPSTPTTKNRSQPKIKIIREESSETQPNPGPRGGGTAKKRSAKSASAPVPVFAFTSDWSPTWFPNRLAVVDPGPGNVKQLAGSSRGHGTTKSSSAGSKSAMKMMEGASQPPEINPGPGPERRQEPKTAPVWLNCGGRSIQGLQVVGSKREILTAPPPMITNAIAAVPVPTPPPPTPRREKVVSRDKLQTLMKTVDPTALLEKDVGAALEDFADMFLTQLLEGSCQLAKHRGSSKMEVSDFAFYLERQQNMKVSVEPNGEFSVKQMKSKVEQRVHQQQMDLMNGTLRKY